MLKPRLTSRVEILAPEPSSDHPFLLSREALGFIAELVANFRHRVDELLESRRERQRRFDLGEKPDFLASTKWIRESDWSVAPIPSS